MDITTLENWLWEAACSIRGPLDAPKYKDYILPLLFYKRLCDVFEDELERLTREFGDADLARELVAQDPGLIRFDIPDEHTWDQVRRSPTKLGERLTEAMQAIARKNSKLQGVIDRRDFNATEAGQRLLEDEALARLMEILNQHRLGLNDVEPDILGRAYEYLLRKFAEGGGQSAGEFFTPREVGGVLGDKIRILARNTIPELQCTDCGAEATDVCVECWELYCKTHLVEHSDGEEMALPVVNSPRMGVCGFTGDCDFDDFKPPS